MKPWWWQVNCGCLGAIVLSLLISTVSGEVSRSETSTEPAYENLIFDLAGHKQTLEAIADIGESLQRLQALDTATLRRLAKLESNPSLQRVIGLLIDEDVSIRSVPYQIDAKHILLALPDDQASGQTGRIMIDWQQQVLLLKSGQKTATKTGYISLLSVENVGNKKTRLKITLATQSGSQEIYFPNES